MLKKFTVSNYRQFNEPLEFDLTAGGYTFNPECVQNDLVKLALIYGENGTGKSVLALAMFDVVAHLTDNMADLKNHDYLNAFSSQPYATFKFEFEFDVNGLGIQELTYEYKKDKHKVLLSEKLFINKKIMIDYELGEEFDSQLLGTENLNKKINSRQNISVLKYIFSSSNLNEYDKDNLIFIHFMKYINNILCFRNVALQDSHYIGYQSMPINIEKYIIKNNKVNELESFLKECGLNIEICIKDREMIGIKMGEKEISFFANASTGAVTLVYFYYWLQEVEKSNIPLLFIDEFDCSYHFALSEKIVEKLKQLPNTQVILTTHNTNLLSNELIRPDCGFVIDGKQIKSLNKLTVRELRYAHNLERMYQAGEFDND